MPKKNTTRRLTTCALLAALGVVLLYLGSMIEVLDISMAVIVSLFCIFAVIEYGGSAPWLIYTVTAVLSLLLLPNKTPAVLYLLFFGYYPILKEKLERKSRPVSWILKELIFHAALVVMLVLYHITLTAENASPWFFYAAFILLAEIAFPLYDIALTRLISLYLFKLRKLFRIQ
ncbi:MAG: hypothetical protein IJW44_03565 [Clostridia bacterium]|nr:hypothetical protein [Clostridia bacterium]